MNVKKLLIGLLFLGVLVINSFADPVPGRLNIEETDGSPSTFPYKLIVGAGSLTDNSDGTSTLSTGGAPINATYLTSTANASLTNEVDLGSLSTGLLKGTVAGGVSTISSITDSSANWDTAYTDRLKWDGGATGLVAATGRTSLGLVIGTDVQAYDADLTTWAGITPGANVGTFLATPSSANLLAAVTDETGTGLAVFGTSPTFTTQITTPKIVSAGDMTFDAVNAAANSTVYVLNSNGTYTADLNVEGDLVVTDVTVSTGGTLQLGQNGTDGLLKIYSEQGATDYIASLYSNTAMTSAASFYLPADEPAAQSFLSMSTGGVMSFVAPNAGTDIANDLEEEVTEGSLADSVIVSADIKNGEIVSADLSGTAGVTLAQTAMTAGRSLTISTNDVAVDDEAVMDTKCVYWENPVAGDDFKSVFIFKQAATITQVFCESDQTVNMTLQEDDGTPADIETTDFVCDATPPTQTTGFEDTAMAAGSRLDFDVTSVSGTPTWCSMCFSFTYDD